MFVGQRSLFLALILAILTSVGWTSSQDTLGVQLSYTGEFSAYDVNLGSGEIWYALLVDSASSRLQECRIAVLSSEPESTSGGHFYRHLDVKIDPPVTPKLLVRGSSRLSGGSLRGDIIEEREVRPGEIATLGIYGGENVKLQGSERPLPKRQPHSSGWTHYSLVLKGDGVKPPQQIANMDRWPHSFLPTILWAGDLDRDGAPDLLVDFDMGEEGARDVCLFLSSMARDFERVHLAAKLQTMGD
jgi:hypothetical protein